MSSPFPNSDPYVIRSDREGIATLTLNRPDSRNALSRPMMVGLAESLQRLALDPAIRAVVLTGAGRAFSAGGNVKAMQHKEGAFAGSPADVREGYRANIHRIARSLFGLETPLIAAARARGLATVDGLGMLIHQGARAFEIWFGVRPDVRGARLLLERALVGEAG
jgi:enoyl-CoA hydratase/carnithine racemase